MLSRVLLLTLSVACPVSGNVACVNEGCNTVAVPDSADTQSFLQLQHKLDIESEKHGETLVEQPAFKIPMTTICQAGLDTVVPKVNTKFAANPTPALRTILKQMPDCNVSTSLSGTGLSSISMSATCLDASQDLTGEGTVSASAVFSFAEDFVVDVSVTKTGTSKFCQAPARGGNFTIKGLHGSANMQFTANGTQITAASVGEIKVIWSEIVLEGGRKNAQMEKAAIAAGDGISLTIEEDVNIAIEEAMPITVPL